MNNSRALADHAAPGADLGAGHNDGCSGMGSLAQDAPRNEGIFLLLKG